MRIIVAALLFIIGIAAIIFAYVGQTGPLVFFAGLTATVGGAIWIVLELATVTAKAVVMAGIGLVNVARRG